MKKVWIYKRKNIKGWWVGWYESGKRKTKALPNKALAEHFRRIKYAQLNSDVFTGTVAVDWAQMREEYTHYKKVKGDEQATLYETALTLSHFERLIGRCSSRQITQNAIDKFILDRGKEIKRSTLNKDIRNLRAFIHWCRKNRYLNGEIELSLLKEDERPVKSLSGTQIQELLTASLPFPALRMRILLALGTGLRRGDIESWRVSDLDFENGSVTTRSTKTRKSMGSRPLPVPIMAELKKYVSGLPPGQDKIFKRCFNRSRWDKVRQKVGLTDFKFHDLRKTFDSVLAQNGVSTAVIQRLLEHSSPDLTNKVYMNVDPVLRHAIDTMPVGDWLRIRIVGKRGKNIQ
ncbi:MAG: tyrosine-type recombinase/integrase [Planctomycetota bacterium]|jgi:integrase